MRPLPLTRALLVILTLGLAVSGCSKIMGPKQGGEPIPDYPDGPAGLEALFRDVLDAAKADNRARVHDLFQSLKLTRPELDALFGARADELSLPYDEMMATLIHRGAIEIVAVVYEKKYDTVEVFPLALEPGGPSGDGGAAEKPRPEDLALGRALLQHPPVYSVRFKKAGEALGTRYDFFIYRDGKWRTGNQLGKFLLKRERELTPAKPAR